MQPADSNTTAPVAEEDPPLSGAVSEPAPLRVPSWLWLLIAALILVAFSLLYTFNPAQHSFYPFCAFHRMTGLDCPGCGGLRAIHQLLHGHFLTAFRLNPLAVSAVPVLVVLGLRRWLGGPGKTVPPKSMVRWGWVTLVILVVYGIVRNLPIPFFAAAGG